jgi:hypothetical protein
MAIYNIHEKQALKKATDTLVKEKKANNLLYLVAGLILTNFTTIAYIWLK